ncbi:MAG TPA: Gfo/Idh/MocA family oxidoreductase [Anaerohalosphaeraceae bacterium]|jgi:predicted dehydrogenase|nr:Gfo/Idh/MocA family oxidoreductase [Anaerohalosphaeraceae bacterium]HRT50885.1 Gfo/Idh/MocA family oxidoreductase [Anaerohalosphaeraceae bacterium]HRT86867.1 Gfo/Idh/MocA family oxidoreductase [Anaerohalosphaeraceae bacterium]
MADRLTRRGFLRNGAAAGLGLAASGALLQTPAAAEPKAGPATMMDFAPPAKDLIRVGFVGIGNMGSGHVNNLLKIEGCQITAVCDIRPERTRWAADRVKAAGFPEPKAYTAGDYDFERMCAEEDLDLVYNAAPWRWHTPICLAAMKNGKHAASEVNIALTVEDCWKLVEASEKYKRHCVMQENCCYDSTEMVVLNMIQQGLFGEVLHGECGYLHDLRGLKISPSVYQGMWRVQHSIHRNGNLYPTHGIGPMAWCMDIHRGDAFDTLVSMSTKSIGLNLYAAARHDAAKSDADKAFYAKWRDQKYALGDVNITLIKTKKGRTIICKHDTNLPRPYSRDFLVQGTKGLVRKYPTELLHIEGLTPGHDWQNLAAYREKYEHPVWKTMKERAKGAGHGGMDFIEDWRLINALRRGHCPDIDVYDSVAWSAIIPLSEESINKGSAPVPFPDFTRGAWEKPRPLGVSQWL